VRIVALAALLFLGPSAVAAQDRPRDDAEGSAVIQVGDQEYTIPILCDDATSAAAGFITEPSRVTRERTGRSSLVNLRARPVEGHDELIVTLDRYLTWIPSSAASGPSLEVEIDMGLITILRDNMPVLVTREMWANGEQGTEIEGVIIEARCDARDPAAPTSRRIGLA
jgi:hypothetical protein